MSAVAPAAVAFAAKRAVAGGGVSEKAVLLAEGGLRGMFGGRMLLAVLLLVGGAVIAGAAVKQQETGQESVPQTPSSGAARTERVDCYGDPLPQEAISRLGTVRLRHGQFPTFVRFTADGKGLISQAFDGVRIWEVATGKQLHALPQKETGGWGNAQASLSPDGKLLATASESGLRLWDAATAMPVRTLNTKDYFAPCFSPDGTRLAVLTSDFPRVVELLEASTGRSVWSWSPGKLPLCCTAFSADGKYVVVAGWGVLQTPPMKDNTIRFLDARTGKECRAIDLGTHVPNKIALSPDGTLLAAICFSDDGRWDRFIRVWEVAGGKERFRLEPPIRKDVFQQKHFSALAFAPDDNTLLTAGGFEGLIAWDPATGKERRRFGRGATNSSDLAFSPDGKAVAAARPSNVCVIDRATGGDLTPTGGHRITVVGAAFAPDGQTVITTSAGPCILFWDPLTGRELRRTEWYDPGLHYQLTSDGRTAISMKRFGPEKALSVWDLGGGKERARLSLDFVSGQPTLKAIGPGGRILAVGPNDGNRLYLIDFTAGRRLKSIQDPGLKANHADFADDGRILVAYCADHTVQVWDVARGAKLRQFGPLGQVHAPGPRPVGSEGSPYEAALSPDGKWIAYGNQNGSLAILETATGQEVRRINKVSNGLGVLAFSPDSRTLAWVGDESSIHLMEVASGKERHALAGHRGLVLSLNFSRNGRTLVSTSIDTTALVWDLTGRLAAKEAWSRPPAPEELDTCWKALAGEDAAVAYEALRRLAASAAQAVPYLARRIHAARPADEKRLAGLIADLDSSDFTVREKASKGLEALGEAAVGACRKALQGQPSAEARRRLERVIELESQERRTPSPAGLRALRALEVLELAGTPEARQLLEKWAGGAAEARLSEEAKSSLERLARRSR
jgi:WD40 repeat protein